MIEHGCIWQGRKTGGHEEEGRGSGEKASPPP